MRMRSSAFAVVSASFALLLPHVQAAPSTGCPLLVDPTSPFLYSLSLLLNSTTSVLFEPSILDVFYPIQLSYPWLSDCLASVDAISLATTMLSHPKATTCLTQWEKTTTTYDTMDDAYYREYWCPWYKDTAIPCLHDVVVSSLSAAMNGGCCDDMKKEMVQRFNTTLDGFVGDLLKLGGNVACSVKSYSDADGDRHLQSCGQSWATAYAADAPALVEGFLQLPNGQACIAMNGAPFKTTKVDKVTFGSPAGDPQLGICFRPVETLMQYVSQWPILGIPAVVGDYWEPTTIQLADVFATDVCVNGSHVLDTLLSNTSGFQDALRIGDEALQLFQDLLAVSNVNNSGVAYWTDRSSTGNLTTYFRDWIAPHVVAMDQSCMHLATGISCPFVNQTIVLPFDVQVPSPAPTTVPMELVPKKTSAAASTGNAVAAAVATLAVALLSFWAS